MSQMVALAILPGGSEGWCLTSAGGVERTRVGGWQIVATRLWAACLVGSGCLGLKSKGWGNYKYYLLVLGNVDGDVCLLIIHIR